MKNKSYTVKEMRALKILLFQIIVKNNFPLCTLDKCLPDLLHGTHNYFWDQYLIVYT